MKILRDQREVVIWCKEGMVGGSVTEVPFKLDLEDQGRFFQTKGVLNDIQLNFAPYVDNKLAAGRLNMACRCSWSGHFFLFWPAPCFQK